MSKEMMICPDKKCSAYGTKETPHCRQHRWCQSCANPALRKHKTCPPCIPYIPEQPKKPVEPTCPARHWDNECSCGHLRIHHTDWTGKCHCCDEGENPCKCKSFTPADLQPEPFKRYMKYEVMKLDDIKKYLTPNQKTNLEDIIRTLQNGRSKDGKVPCNSYVVVKEGLPYTEQVWKLIKDYETEPERQTSRDFDTIEHEAEMPLIWNEKLGSESIMGNRLIRIQRASDMAWLPARDSAVASKLHRLELFYTDVIAGCDIDKGNQGLYRQKRVIIGPGKTQDELDLETAKEELKEVASKAVKEFAEKIIVTMPEYSDSDYTAGLINDYGGGNVGWWQDYIRCEVERCNEYWKDRIKDAVEMALAHIRAMAGKE